MRTNTRTKHIPIIFLAEKDERGDRIAGLELGADDYITKPFQLREVLARIRAVLRRAAVPSTLAAESSGTRKALRFGNWILDSTKRELRTAAGSVCELTTGEFNLLSVFAAHPHHVLSRDQIMDLLHGHDWNPSDRSIDNLIVKLRRKIEADPVRPELIKSVRGVGYCFATNVAVEA